MEYEKLVAKQQEEIAKLTDLYLNVAHEAVSREKYNHAHGALFVLAKITGRNVIKLFNSYDQLVETGGSFGDRLQGKKDVYMELMRSKWFQKDTVESVERRFPDVK